VGVSLAVPFEIKGGSPEAVQGIRDPVLGIWYSAVKTFKVERISTFFVVSIPERNGLEMRAGNGGAPRRASFVGLMPQGSSWLLMAEH
jgi:hypothetical protein